MSLIDYIVCQYCENFGHCEDEPIGFELETDSPGLMVKACSLR